MAKPMIRTQLLLEPEQHTSLSHIAREENRSVSDPVREIVREALAERELAVRRQRAAKALERLNQLREVGPLYSGDPIAEVRAEREKQVDELWRES